MKPDAVTASALAAATPLAFNSVASLGAKVAGLFLRASAVVCIFATLLDGAAILYVYLPASVVLTVTKLASTANSAANVFFKDAEDSRHFFNGVRADGGQ